MTIKSDYMTGYDNGWRDGVKDYKEKNKPFTAPTTESSPVAWIWHERAYELNGYEGRTRLAIDKPKMGPYECNLAPLYAAQTTGSAPVAGYFRETAWLSNGKRAIEQVPDTCREEDFVFPLFATPPANAPVASVPLKREFFQNWADYDAYRKSLIASPAASVLTDGQIKEHFDSHARYALEGSKLYWDDALAFARALLAASMGGEKS